MDPRLGWVLAVVALLVGWRVDGWHGVLLAVTVTVFWLLLQFSRAMRAMKSAGQAPLGSVPSAVMLNAKLQRGMTMLKVIGLTRSLGASVPRSEATGDAADDTSDKPNTGNARNTSGPRDDLWRWADAGGSCVTLTFVTGRLQHWQLWRPAQSADESPPPSSAAEARP